MKICNKNVYERLFSFMINNEGAYEAWRLGEASMTRRKGVFCAGKKIAPALGASDSCFFKQAPLGKESL